MIGLACAWAACVPVAVFSLVAPAAVADTIPFIVPVEQTTTVTARVTRGADTIVESDTTPEYTYVFDPAQPFRPHPGVIGVELELSDRSQYSAASDPLELGRASAGLDGAGVTTARIDAALTGSDAFDPTILRAEVVQISRAGVPGGAAQLGYEFWLGDMLIEIWDANRIGGGPDPFADPTGGSGAIGARF